MEEKSILLLYTHLPPLPPPPLSPLLRASVWGGGYFFSMLAVIGGRGVGSWERGSAKFRPGGGGWGVGEGGWTLRGGGGSFAFFALPEFI